jgi:predicted TIM-barrel fold metal-dependent hydrolase
LEHFLRLDAHQHFWKFDPNRFGWITEEMAALQRDFLPVDLHPLLRAAGFDGSIAVQARQSLDETRWLLDAIVTRETFVSWPDRLLVIHVSADKPGRISLGVQL